MHDEVVDRTTDGTGAISQMTAADLHKLDAGYRFTRDGGQTFPYRGMGLTVPTLDEVLDAFPDALLAVELKQYRPSIVEAVISRFEAHKAMGRTIFAAFDDTTIRALRQRAPSEVSALATGEMLRLIGLPEADVSTYVPPADIVQPPMNNVTPELLSMAHGFGLKVHPWTVNARADMERLVDMGVDGMYTDDPETLLAVLKAKGR